MKYSFLFLLLLTPFFDVIAQYNIKGVVIDSTTGKPLEYASVVNLTLNKVAYTDELGQFELTLNSKADRIQASNMGYRPRILTGLTEGLNVKVILTETPILIKEVSVSKRKLKKHSVELGFHNYETHSTNWGPGGEVSNLFAVYIKNNNISDGEIGKAYFKLGKYIIGRNGFSKARVRILSVNTENGLPDSDLLRENTIASINPFSQSFSISLEQHHIPVPKEGIFIGLEFFCFTDKKPLGRGRYSLKTNCPHIAVTKMKNYKDFGGSFYHVYDFSTKTWKWFDIANGEYSKAFSNQVWKFGIKVNYYD